MIINFGLYFLYFKFYIADIILDISVVVDKTPPSAGFYRGIILNSLIRG